MASARDLTLEALNFIGIDTIAKATQPMLRRITRDLTSALQITHTHGPLLYKGRYGGATKAPERRTYWVTSGSASLSRQPGDSPFALGSSIVIDGDPTVNCIVGIIDSENALLAVPYKGTNTGSKGATVYFDAVALPSTIYQVTGKVFRDEKYPIRKINTRPAAGNFSAAPPVAYWIDSGFSSQTNTLKHSIPVLKLYPFPDQAYTIGFDVIYTPPSFGVSDLGTDSVDSTIPLIAPGQYSDSIVRPIFLYLWSTGPWYRRESPNPSELKRGYDDALERLEQFKIQKQYRGEMIASY